MSADDPSLSRRSFVQAGAFAAAALGLPGSREAAEREPIPPAPLAAGLEEATIADLRSGMERGSLTSRGITRDYLRRIAALDRAGPSLRAVIETNPDALTIAADLDAERKAGRVRGPLHGVPVIVKDNIDTHDRMQTTAGSLALEGNLAERDSFVVERLRAAGCVILAKANLSEWANFRSTRSSSGWSGRGRQCRNPFVLDRTPSGSSAGSGSAVSANFCAAAIGTETDGSIVSPSNACGVVGLKPTVGLVSRAGIIPIAHSQDTAGPMCRTVADAAAMLSALAGVDPRDPATAEAGDHLQADYTTFLDRDGLRGARIGVAYERTGANPVVDRLVEGAIATLTAAGAVIVDPAKLETADKIGTNERTVLQYEFKADLNAYLATMPAGVPYRTLAQLIEYNRTHADREMPYFDQEIFIASEALGPLTEQAYLDARAACVDLTRAKGIDATMDKYGLDALMGPSGGPAGLIDLVTLTTGGGPGSSRFPAIAGYPHITVPAAFHLGLPMGISFYGRAWSEPVLLKLAYGFEQATRVRRAPSFVPTVALS